MSKQFIDVGLSEDNLAELIQILEISGLDADTAIRQSHDLEEVDALKQHKISINEWLARFKQLKQRINAAK